MKHLRLFLPILLGILFVFSVAKSSTDTTKRISVYISFSEVCPLCKEMLPSIEEIIQKFESKCFFYFVLTNKNVSKEKLYRLIEKFQKKPILIFDSSKTVAKRFGFTVTPEVVVLNVENEVMYSGALDDRFVDFGQTKKHSIKPHLHDALQSIIKGKSPSIVSTKAFGCYISYRPQYKPIFESVK